jgi:prevent-host-death family protein
MQKQGFCNSLTVLMACCIIKSLKGALLMQVALSDLKTNVGKYVDLADTVDVIITKYGKPAAKIIRYDKEPWYMKKLPEKITSVDNLFGTIPNDIDLDDVRLERLSK